ncbi:hypothetical protein A2767_07265 [Candidatus Roizmanbacteria bacterium RIFCSPHIGHO2_01_FULL_35_10]|uniref:Uncharacterized protein n=1 Tax=Candidatus Roizmanbacteria bacterium RIFCSPLOWO2_01_FULL_35_13 TaxID=1802055 RepID=A0A1F7I821_9BACT|nr:MAG: hypothetical protein A2767_07265 [Candidatus Roizmanbacteria bacterium RIFCSPHIGHO2_01_FULL_35_10]OGK39516.1 MAG: hypothetical protein A3A74_00655 [Candidatus Roizmanbacteria bacterium RIFCSPLOWO2_01_FULL_35_13]
MTDKRESTRSIWQIAHAPKDRKELLDAVERQHSEYTEFMLKNWKPVSNVLVEQNELVENFLRGEGVILNQKVDGSRLKIDYEVKANFRSQERTIQSSQGWLPNDEKDPLRGMLSHLWQWEFVDQIMINLVGKQGNSILVEGEKTDYFLYEYPNGSLNIYSKGLQSAIGSRRVDLTLQRFDQDRVLSVAKYFRDYTKKLLARSGAKVIQG